MADVSLDALLPFSSTENFTKCKILEILTVEFLSPLKVTFDKLIPSELVCESVPSYKKFTNIGIILVSGCLEVNISITFETTSDKSTIELTLNFGMYKNISFVFKNC